MVPLVEIEPRVTEASLKITKLWAPLVDASIIKLANEPATPPATVSLPCGVVVPMPTLLVGITALPAPVLPSNHVVGRVLLTD